MQFYPPAKLMTNDTPGELVDIHSHFLPFLDDGTENYDQCLAAAKHYVNSGFDTVIATPHYIPGTTWTPSHEQIKENIEQTRNLLEQHEIFLTILPGMEIMLSNIDCSHFDFEKYLSLGDQGCYLIEFPLNTPLNTSIENLFKRLLSFQGIRYIIAHPERCRIFHERTSCLEELIEQGMMTQINIDSVLGVAGNKVRQKAIEFLRSNLVHFLASDSHPGQYRMPPDIDAMRQLKTVLGEETALKALKNNPQSMLASKKVDPLVFDGNILFLTEEPVLHKGYMQKLKNLFTTKKRT